MSGPAGTPLSTRQRIARRVPGWVRKGVRMGEHYLNRLRAWREVSREMRAVSASDRAVLRRSMLLAPITALARPDSYQPPRLVDDLEVEVTGVGRFCLRAGTDDILHVLSAREPHVRRAITERLQPGGTFVDAGANIGFYSILAAKLVGPSGRVVAFEMMPDTADILRRHVTANGASTVRLVENALADKAGERIVASVEPGKHGQASIVTEDRGHERVRIEVLTTTLDDELTALERIDVLKMDLEGAEFLAMQGGQATLGRTRCVIFESNGEDPRIFDLLSGQGFASERLAGHDFIAERPAAAAMAAS